MHREEEEDRLQRQYNRREARVLHLHPQAMMIRELDAARSSNRESHSGTEFQFSQRARHPLQAQANSPC